MSNVPSSGEIRVTVPLDGAALIHDGLEVSLEGGRFEVCEGVDLVMLHDEEKSRLAERNIYTECRMEFFGLLPAGWDYLSIYDRRDESKHLGTVAEGEATVRRVLHVLSLHALVSRMPWRPAAIALDIFEGGAWRRLGFLESKAEWGRAQHGYSWFPVERLETWRELVRHWTSDPALDLALQYYAESVIERSDRRYERALVSAAIATEVLLGERTELSYRISVRGAHLVATGEDALRVQRRLKRLYDARSQLVHAGKYANPDDCTAWQQFLMAAIPRAAAHPSALAVLRQQLDQSNFVRSQELKTLDAGGWWSYCDFAALVDR